LELKAYNYALNVNVWTFCQKLPQYHASAMVSIKQQLLHTDISCGENDHSNQISKWAMKALYSTKISLHSKGNSSQKHHITFSNCITIHYTNLEYQDKIVFQINFLNSFLSPFTFMCNDYFEPLFWYALLRLAPDVELNLMYYSWRLFSNGKHFLPFIQWNLFALNFHL